MVTGMVMVTVTVTVTVTVRVRVRVTVMVRVRVTVRVTVRVRVTVMVMVRGELAKVNTFRKVRLAYALKFRTTDASSILYKIRNGKGYAMEFDFNQQATANRLLKVVLETIVADLKKSVKGQKIFLPENITYALPVSEKQFTGDFPSGTFVSIPKDMIFGIHWENTKGNRIDLDLALLNHQGKIGWDGGYRSEAGKILFSGDLTDAPMPKGATELFYVKRQGKNASIMTVNFYNFYDTEGVEVPLKIVVGHGTPKSFRKGYILDPNSVLAIARTSISQQQKTLGLLVTTTKECRFYFTEVALGRSISSSNSEAVVHTRNYLFDFYENTIGMRDLLKKAGAKFTTKRDKCDIDLSPETIEKDTIINLLRG